MTVLFFIVQIFLSCRSYPALEGYLDQQKERAKLESLWIEREDFRLHYWKGGNPDGKTILFIHGFGGDAIWAWGRNLPAFAEEYQIIAVDLLWFGESVAYSGKPTLLQQQKAVEQLLIHEKINSFHSVALSYGGFVALQLLESGWNIEKLALVGVGSTVDIQRLKETYSKDSVSEIFVPEQKEDVRRLLDICFYTPMFLVPNSLSGDLYQTVFGRHPQEQRLLMQDLIENMDQYSSVISSSKIDTQGLIIVGALDPIFTHENINELSTKLDAGMIIYPRANHVPNIGYPRRFNTDIHRLLNDESIDQDVTSK